MENADEKTCPACAETIKAAANKCRYCGHSFVQEAEVSDVPEVKSSSGGAVKKGCLWVVGIFVVLVIIGSLLPEPPGGNGSKGNPPDFSEFATVVSARDLAAAYDANEAGAQQRYGDDPLQVSGHVTAVSLDFMDNPVVQFAGVNQFLDVHAKLVGDSRDRAGSISKGQQLTVRCERVSEVISAPMLDDCHIVD